MRNNHTGSSWFWELNLVIEKRWLYVPIDGGIYRAQGLSLVRQSMREKTEYG